MIWPFKVRDLPETKNRLIPERVERPRYEFPRDVIVGHSEMLERLIAKHKANQVYLRRQAATNAQNSTPNYHPSVYQNAANDVDLFSIEMARNMYTPEVTETPAADFGGGDSGGGGASDSWSSNE